MRLLESLLNACRNSFKSKASVFQLWCQGSIYRYLISITCAIFHDESNGNTDESIVRTVSNYQECSMTQANLCTSVVVHECEQRTLNAVIVSLAASISKLAPGPEFEVNSARRCYPWHCQSLLLTMQHKAHDSSPSYSMQTLSLYLITHHLSSLSLPLHLSKTICSASTSGDS